MWIRSVYMSLIGTCSGFGVAAGTFAFFLVMRVIPRMVQKAKLNNKIMSIENMVIRGLLFGTILSLFTWKKKWLYWLFGRLLLVLFGLGSGIFAGCIAVALAEILDIFPIFLRRSRLNPKYMGVLLLVMAIGKTLGSLFYFYMGYGVNIGS